MATSTLKILKRNKWLYPGICSRRYIRYKPSYLCKAWSEPSKINAEQAQTLADHSRFWILFKERGLRSQYCHEIPRWF